MMVLGFAVDVAMGEGSRGHYFALGAFSRGIARTEIRSD